MSPRELGHQGPCDHLTLSRRVVLTGKLVAHTALHVGKGRETDPTAVDSVVVRDGSGRPFVPGSSLKGVLRSAIESIIRGLNVEGLDACDPFEEKEKESRSCSAIVEEELKSAEKALKGAKLGEAERARITWDLACPICRLFGCASFAGRVRVDDLPLLGELALIETRHGVGLDRDRRTARQGILYEYEAVPSGSEFGLRLTFDNPTDAELGLVAAGLSALHEGFAAVGGKGTRGLGAVEVWLNEPIERRATDFFRTLAKLPDEAEGSMSPDQALRRYLEAAREALAL
jgi:CRISPR-associated RAMP protein (TIGR02581 family)